MKIAICGKNDTARASVIKAFISQWPMYATPAETIFNTEREWPENCPAALDNLKHKLNDAERYMMNKILLLEEQYEKYKEQSYMIYDGSALDILVNALILCEEGYISEDVVEKIIYHNKKMLHSLDVVYWLPDYEVSDESSEDDKKLESVYWNLYDNYQTDFRNSPFFDPNDCASILILESKNPIAEIKMLLDSNGNLEGTSHGDELVDTEKLRKVLRGHPKLLEAAMESLKAGQQTVPGGFSGSITL